MFDPTGCCPDCGVSRQDAEFYGNGSREKRCKPCYRLHLRVGYAPKRQALDALKLAQKRGCRCDHLPGQVKSFNVSDVPKAHTLPELLHEVAKCEVVCANCHRVRTAQRPGLRFRR